eukprot:4485881-Prymnesium_polylepis.1
MLSATAPRAGRTGCHRFTGGSAHRPRLCSMRPHEACASRCLVHGGMHTTGDEQLLDGLHGL